MCEECIHKSVCYRVDSVHSDYARKCGDFVSGCKSFDSGLKDERKKIAEDIADKMNYMGSCLNEKNVILGIITGKRETPLDSLCPICKSEDCVSNGTAISKADYENRLKADMITTLDKIRTEIESQRKEVSKKHSEDEGLSNYYFGLNDGLKDARDIIDKYKEESEDKDDT